MEREQPRLAQVGREKLGRPGVVLVATIRRDGSPRVSPVEALFEGGELWLTMGWGSLKVGDLARDPRILVHSVVVHRDGSDGEFKVRGRAVPETDRAVQERVAQVIREEVGWEAEAGKFHLFRVDVQDITVMRWVDATNDQFVTRWPEGGEFVRRGTSATSHGPPEPISDLLV
jgi:Pyridoxamine 5'-phosphate oxidase